MLPYLARRPGSGMQSQPAAYFPRGIGASQEVTSPNLDEN